MFLAPPKILNISEADVYELSKTVTLKCNVEGDPRPLISWTFQGENGLSPLTSPKYQFSKFNQLLVIVNITLKEEGVYICEAKNMYGVEKRNVSVNVNVKGMLTFFHLNFLNKTIAIL